MLYEIMKLFAMCHVSQFTFEDIGHPSEIVYEILIQILIGWGVLRGGGGGGYQHTWVLCLESPGNFLGPKPNIKSQIWIIKAQVLANIPFH